MYRTFKCLCISYKDIFTFPLGMSRSILSFTQTCSTINDNKAYFNKNNKALYLTALTLTVY